MGIKTPFAHLARGKANPKTNPKTNPQSAKAAEDDEEAKRAEEERRAEEDDDETDSSDTDASADPEDGDGEDESDGRRGKRAKRAKRAESDDDEDKDGDEEDQEDEKDPDAKAARARERSRIRAIVESEPGRANPKAAYRLALKTNASRNTAIAMLELTDQSDSAPAPRRDALRDRMQEAPKTNVGPNAELPAPNLAQQIINAGKKARGEI